MTEIEYRASPDAPLERAVLKGDPFDVCDRVQRKLFPVLLEDGWARLLEHRKRIAEREAREVR